MYCSLVYSNSNYVYAESHYFWAIFLLACQSHKTKPFSVFPFSFPFLLLYSLLALPFLLPTFSMDMSMPDHSQHGAYYHSVPPPQHQPPPPPQYHHPYFAAPAAAPWQPPPPPPPTYAHTQPKLTTSIWEDQNTLCFQVDARGICVSRRNGKALEKEKENFSTDQN